jgi:transcriptional regulator with XRE-family HTH domain
MNLKNLRIRNGFSQAALGKRAGVDQTYISKVELKQRPLLPGLAQKISEILGVPVSLILKNEDEGARKGGEQ